MKKTLLFAFLIICCAGYGQKYSSFGKKFKSKNVQDVNKTAEILANANSVDAKLKGEVVSVCQVKGCWMKLKLEDGKTMHVTFKDYGFFVPKDITGKTVLINGTAKVKTTSVDELKHYAEDAGKSKEEIAKISTPEKAIGFVADGVLIEQ